MMVAMEIEVQTSNRGGVLIDADVRDGLALHEDTQMDGRYTITHIASGLAVVARLRSVEAAERIMGEMLAWGVDWTQERGQLAKDRELAIRVDVLRQREEVLRA